MENEELRKVYNICKEDKTVNSDVRVNQKNTQSQVLSCSDVEKQDTWKTNKGQESFTDEERLERETNTDGTQQRKRHYKKSKAEDFPETSQL